MRHHPREVVRHAAFRLKTPWKHAGLNTTNTPCTSAEHKDMFSDLCVLHLSYPLARTDMDVDVDVAIADPPLPSSKAVFMSQAA